MKHLIRIFLIGVMLTTVLIAGTEFGSWSAQGAFETSTDQNSSLILGTIREDGKPYLYSFPAQGTVPGNYAFYPQGLPLENDTVTMSRYYLGWRLFVTKGFYFTIINR